MDGGGNDYYDQNGGGAPGDDFREDNLTGRVADALLLRVARI